MNSNKIDLIFSLGAACSCTELLRMMNLQNYSYPFDWVSEDSFESRIHLLVNDFNNFIPKESLEFRGFTDPRSQSNVYMNTQNGMLFQHDFPIDENFDIAYEKVLEKYQRRIKRLLKFIDISQTIFMLYINRPDLTSDDTIQLSLLKSYTKLVKKWHNKNIVLLYFTQDTAKPILEVKNINDKLIYISGDYRSTDDTAPPHVPDMIKLGECLASIIENYIKQ